MTDKFVEELLKSSLISKKTFDILNKNLGYELLPSEPYKAIWKEIKTFYSLENKSPTIGLLSQSFVNEPNEVLKKQIRQALVNINSAEVNAVEESLLKSFEDFKKEEDFRILYNEVHEVYTSGNPSKAISMMAKKSQEIAEFSIKSAFYDRVYADFEKRQVERNKKDREIFNDYIPTGIDELDWITKGFKKGRSFCYLAQSGRGKSTALRHHAITAARLGYRVVLFSHEGTQQENLDLIDAAWTSTPMENIEFGALDESKIKRIKKALDDIIHGGGEIIVYSAESFDSMTIDECRLIMQEIEKLYGKIDMALFDYLELFTTSSEVGSKGESGERRRRESISNKITALATEMNIVTGTATQSNDVPQNLWDNPDFVLTRNNISEYKGAIKPFSYFLTINQTGDEKDQAVCRIYCDKFRFSKAGQIIKIFQAMEINRFYDAKKTLQLLWDRNLKKKIRP